ncbi:hypothetical protein [Thalassolituus oleivorans]|nr:hypothetical protein [Thalassolituus oleivorans]
MTLYDLKAANDDTWHTRGDGPKKAWNTCHKSLTDITHNIK